MRLRIRATVRMTTMVAAATIAAQTADAQNAGDRDRGATAAHVEEIVVTARGRVERLQDVPVPVSVVSDADLLGRGALDLSALTSVTPGLFHNRYSSGRNDRGYNIFVFRGLNLPNFDGTSASSTLFLDGAPAISGALDGLSGVKQIEVLRGPQSVVFGRATMGGAINVITKTPSLEKWAGEVDLSAGTFDTLEGSVSADGPLVADKLAIRLNARAYHTGGQYHNLAVPGETLGARDTRSGALTLYATPADGLTAKLYVTYWQDDDGSSATASFLQPQFNCDPGAGRGRAIYYCGTLPSPYPGDLVGQNDALDAGARGVLSTTANSLVRSNFLDHPGLHREAYHGHADVSYTFGGGYVLRSLTALDRNTWAAFSDGDLHDTRGIPNPFAAAVPGVPPYTNWLLENQARYSDVSEEARITSPGQGRLRWMLGAAFLHENVIAYNILAYAPFGAAYFGQSGTNIANTYSGFGGVYYDVSQDLTVSVEGRYQSDRKRSLTPGVPELAATFTGFDPRLSVNYRLQPEVSLYGLWSRGRRPGGFNGGIVALPAASISQILAQTGAGIAYGQEKLDNFEIGAKTTFLEGRGFLNIDGYYDRLNNEQTTASAAIPNPAQPTTIQTFAVTSNIGRSRLWGVEAEGRMPLMPSVSIEASATWNHTHIVSYNCTVCQTSITGSNNVSGHRLPGSPEFTGSVSAVYQPRLTSDIDGYLRVDLLFQSHVYTDETNLARTPNAARVNLRVGAQRDNLGVELYAKNVFNSRAYLTASRSSDILGLSPNALIVPLPEKTEVGGRLHYAF